MDTKMTETKPDLLPCPFCGYEPETKEWFVGGREQIKIICDGPDCHVYPSLFGKKEKMIEIWNTRPTPSPDQVPGEVLERVRAAWDVIQDQCGDDGEFSERAALEMSEAITALEQHLKGEG